ncbi:MarR family winged helix-turn-helix transcriptional regulator [Myceligenerans pegani]|uniref:MarR family transcriptional regulator n=1 Tax=Myceligenerans pegani TaxID=2776917 RepID=A0ABR9N354_9MICO|nr:MarR family transcriptional regulator [Myceligenerans sp. TRM 65318]MBE1878090.1 MarR family transcriptional regulator [Myceligenerans sp. TRM 65318]MBE3020361.1 MarR family transcriptional regulator [Myceligenerans sp. TRM 65318]
MAQEPRRARLTREELRIWRNYIETAEALRARLEGRLQSESAMSSADYRVLLTLSEAERKTLRSSRLAELIGWQRSRLSHHLGRMEKRGLIRRTTCADDPHGVEVVLTDLGAERFRHGSVPHLRAVHELFVDALTPEQLVQVDDVTAALRRHLDLDPGR